MAIDLLVLFHHLCDHCLKPLVCFPLSLYESLQGILDGPSWCLLVEMLNTLLMMDVVVGPAFTGFHVMAHCCCSSNWNMGGSSNQDCKIQSRVNRVYCNSPVHYIAPHTPLSFQQ